MQHHMRMNCLIFEYIVGGVGRYGGWHINTKGGNGDAATPHRESTIRYKLSLRSYRALTNTMVAGTTNGRRGQKVARRGPTLSKFPKYPVKITKSVAGTAGDFTPVGHGLYTHTD